MRIALLIHELTVQGGGERQCVALARALSKLDHEVTVFTSACDPQNCYPEICSELNIRVVGRGVFSRISTPLFLRRFLDMRRMMKRIDQPHEVWNPHHWPAHWASVWLKRRLGGRVIWMCNDVPDLRKKQQDLQHSAAFLKRLGYFCYSRMFAYDARQIQDIDQVVVLSEWAKSEFLKVYAGQVHVVRSGMDRQQLQQYGNRAKLRERLGIESDCFLILWFGIFMPHRRLEDAIKALALLRKRGLQARLLLAGSDRNFPDYLEHLKQLAIDEDVQDYVVFSNSFRESEIADAFAACDVFLFPNEEQTWGLTPIEAMAAGRAVIVSKGSGVQEVLQDGETAILVPPREPETIASKLELLILNPKLREGLARRGQQYVLNRFSWENYARDMQSVFEQALSSADSSVNDEVRVS